MEQRVLDFFLYHSQEKLNELLYNEFEASQCVYYLFKIQDDHPTTVHGGNLPRSLGILTGHRFSTVIS